jgi:hypothetical protein
MNSAFEAYTRSASFALTLSSPMIDRLMALDRIRQLGDRYPWYRSVGLANFGTPESLVAQWLDSTNRALVRRGLLEVVVPDALPVHRTDVTPLTRAGQLTVGLLTEAGFLLDPTKVTPVPPHPDDRIKVDLGGTTWPTPHDRRLDLMIEEDKPFLGFLRENPVDA